jgi:hypothetical protein
MSGGNEVQLADLVDMSSPAAVFEEVKCNFVRQYPVEEFGGVRQSFKDFKRLFAGEYPGYRACNTRYHNTLHTTDVLLAVSRLIDGYNLVRGRLPVRLVKTALRAAVFHDAGYIQSVADKNGTGAKYTLNHVGRSVEFVEKYFRQRGLPAADARSAGRMVRCTGLGAEMTGIRFACPQEKVLGYMLGTADLLGQMSARNYLERLMFLYREFREGNVGGFGSEKILLEKTLSFYAETRKRLDIVLGGMDRYALGHFRARYRINRNLYAESMGRQMNYLAVVLSGERGSYRTRLRRWA